MGDSHANRLSKDLYLYAQAHQYGYIEMTRASCIGIEGLNFKFKKETDKTACAAHAIKIKETISRLEPSLIVFSARTYYYFNTKTLYAENPVSNRESILINTFKAWSELGHTVAVVHPTPEMKNHIPKQVKKALQGVPQGEMMRALSKLDIHGSYEEYLQKTTIFRHAMDQVAGKDGVIGIQPADIFCSAETGKYAAHNDQKLFYSDRHHMVPRSLWNRSQKRSALTFNPMNPLNPYRIFI